MESPVLGDTQIPVSVLKANNEQIQLDRHLKDAQSNLVSILTTLIPLKQALTVAPLDKKQMHDLLKIAIV